MSVARVGFATSHPFIIHRIFTCFSRWEAGNLVYHRHAYIYAACAHIFVCSIIHAPLPRSRRWHLVGPGPKSPLAKYEKRLVSQYQFRRKNQMSLKCRPGLSYLPLSLSLSIYPCYTHVPAEHLYPMLWADSFSVTFKFTQWQRTENVHNAQDT